MAKNEFLSIATGAGANVLAPAEFAKAPYRQQGFQDGILEPYDLNTVLRQNSSWSTILGQFTADYSGSDVLDDGDLEKLQDQFEAALKIALDIPLETERWHYGRDTSTSANRLVVNLPTVPGEITEGFALAVLVNNANTGSVQISINGQPDLPVTRVNGTSLYPGDIIKPGLALLVHDGARMQLVNPQTIGEIAGLPSTRQLWHYGQDVSQTPNVIEATVDDFGDAYIEGLAVAVRAANTNGGATKINLNGKGLVPLNIGQSTNLNPADVVGGTIALLIFDPNGVSAQLINPQTALSGNGEGPGSGGDGGGTPTPTNPDITGPLAAYWFTVLSNTVATPPVSPNTGDAYLIPVGATGVWTNLEHRLTMWTGSTWVYRAYPKGSLISVLPAGSALADVLERTATGWRSKFSTAEEIALGQSRTTWVSPGDLRDSGLGAGWIYVNTNRLLTAGRYLVDTSAGPLTLTLPANPPLGTIITLCDARATWDANTPTFARNGQTIMGYVEDLTCSVPDLQFTLWFDGSDWRLV